MADTSGTFMGSCGCDPFPAPAEGAACPGCHPSMVLTCEEEAILGRMRLIKEQVHPIADRLHELHGHLSVSHGEHGSEWTELSAQLEDLRAQWREWSARLEDAIDKKLIALGHREPRV